MNKEKREGIARGYCAPSVAAILGSLVTTAAFAGPDWAGDLGKDAGASLLTAQVITINGTVARIRGTLSGTALAGGEGDFQDVYLFQITDPVTFKLDMTSGVGGADFDTCMWLFSFEGKALLGNNDAAPGVLGSLLTNTSNDGPSVTITTPGFYYLAITGFASQPLDGDMPLFADSVFTPGNITGGFDGRFSGSWSGQGTTGTYALDVQGVSGVPAPGAAALLGLAGVLTNRRRRR